MKNMMRYRDGNMMHHVTCITCPIEPLFDENKPPEFEEFDIYYSELHAIDNGWVKTNSKRFCYPGKDFGWVCPDCAKKEQWR